MAAKEEDIKKGVSERITKGHSVSCSAYRQIPPSLAYRTPVPPAPDNPALAKSWSPKGVLEDYRKNREKQEPDYVLDDKFPGYILEEASRNCNWSPVINDRASIYNWGSSKGGYWWETSYHDGSTRQEFYF